MSLNDEITKDLLGRGATMVGFADLTGLDPAARRGYDRAVSVAVAVDRKVLIGIKQGPTAEYVTEYIRVNALLDELDRRCAGLLRAAGYRALERTRDSVPVDEATRRTELPYKTVATRAGLGWIGKCALLINERYGGALRLSVVLTDAPFESAEPVSASRCGECDVCTRGCPAQAVTGQEWRVGMEREELFNAFACYDKQQELNAGLDVKVNLCGKCIVLCPWSRSYLDGLVAR